MSDFLTLAIGVDIQEGFDEIKDFKDKADAAVEEWRLRRIEIIQQVREAVTLISQAMGTLRQFMSLVGAQIDPFYSALIGMTLSTISMMLSVSAGLAATGIGGYAALIIGTIAITLNTLMIGKLIKDKVATMELFNTAIAMTNQRTPIGGSF